MEREAVIKWTHDQGYCRVAFFIDEKVYLLIQKNHVIFDTILGYEKDTSYYVSVDKAREAWTKLKKMNYEEVKV
jgi:hypothetical protein